jgi:ethanolamine utilization protein EutN
VRLCRVIGQVVATAHHPAYDARTVLLVRPEDVAGEVLKAAFVAVDHAQAGPGDRVLVLTEGTGARQLLGPEAGPIRSVIVGVVDAIDGE